jgi:hypothetical protein
MDAAFNMNNKKLGRDLMIHMPKTTKIWLANNTAAGRTTNPVQQPQTKY